FEQRLELRTIHRVGNRLGESGTHLGTLAIANRFDEQVTEGPTLKLEFAKHVENLTAEGLASLVELVEQGAVDVAFAGLFSHQVPEVTDLRLPDAVNTPEPLLQAIGVPRQVVVDHQVGTLQVDALARCIGGEQD